MSFKVFGVALIAAYGNMSAAASPPDTSSKIAELIYFSAAHSNNLKQWVENSMMSPRHKKEALAYLAGHNLTSELLPSMQWKYGSSNLRIGEGTSALAMDFSEMPGNGHLLINNLRIKVKADTPLDDIIYQFRKAASSRQARWPANFFLPEAYAADSSEVLMAAVSYWIGVDQLWACTGGEPTSMSNCIFRSNASMIQASAGGRLTEFRCDGDKFASIRFKGQLGIDLGLAAKYDTSGQLQGIAALQGGEIKCVYGMKDGGVVSLDQDVAGRRYCDGFSKGTYQIGSHRFKKHDKPKSFAVVPVTLERVENCCKDPECKKDIQAAIESELRPAGSSGAETQK